MKLFFSFYLFSIVQSFQSMSFSHFSLCSSGVSADFRHAVIAAVVSLSIDSLGEMQKILGPVIVYKHLMNATNLNVCDEEVAGRVVDHIWPLSTLSLLGKVLNRGYLDGLSSQINSELLKARAGRILGIFLSLEDEVYSSDKYFVALSSEEITFDGSVVPSASSSNGLYSGEILMKAAVMKSQRTFRTDYEKYLTVSHCVDDFVTNCEHNAFASVFECIMASMSTYLQHWRDIEVVIDGADFIPNMRFLFHSYVVHGEHAKRKRSGRYRYINAIAEAMLIATKLHVPESFRRKRENEKNDISSSSSGEKYKQNASQWSWSFFVDLLPGANVASQVSRLRDLMLKFKPVADYDEISTTVFASPHFDEEVWKKLKFAVAQAKEYKAADSKKDVKSISFRYTLAVDNLVQWLQCLILHDDYFYADNSLGTVVKRSQVELALVAKASFSWNIMRQSELAAESSQFYKKDSLSIPRNATSIALVAIVQIVYDIEIDNSVIDEWKHFSQLKTQLNELYPMPTSTPTFSLSDHQDTFAAFDIDTASEEYVCELIRHLARFYFVHLGVIDVMISAGSALFSNQNQNQNHVHETKGISYRREESSDPRILRQVCLILCRLLLPLCAKKMWKAAQSLFELLVSVCEAQTPSSKVSHFVTSQEMFIAFSALSFGSASSQRQHMSKDSNNMQRTVPFILGNLDHLRCITPIDYAVLDGNSKFLGMHRLLNYLMYSTYNLASNNSTCVS